VVAAAAAATNANRASHRCAGVPAVAALAAAEFLVIRAACRERAEPTSSVTGDARAAADSPWLAQVTIKGRELMTDSRPPARPRNGSRLLIAGSTVLATAGVLGLTGLGLATTAMVAMARQRINRMELPPREVAKRQWKQARAAVSAGAGAWRQDLAAPPAGVGSART
jgi:hypothetical protein